jgi:hypothetical protein
MADNHEMAHSVATAPWATMDEPSTGGNQTGLLRMSD